jgi:quercetin dioxygenase-like cupin family protein
MRNNSVPDQIGKPLVFSPQPGEKRPANDYLTSMSFPADDYCVFTANVPAGAIVPLHSHPDRETFYVLSGEMNFYDGTSWRILKEGDCVDVLNSTKHAWRNSLASSASLLVVTTVRMGVFLQRISGADSTKQNMQEASTEKEHFFKLVQEYGYWMGSPEDNRAIGLTTNWHKVAD